MNTKTERPMLMIQTGEDGNPKIYAQGTSLDQVALCTAAVAALCMEDPDPANMLYSMMITAADLMNMAEVVHDEKA